MKYGTTICTTGASSTAAAADAMNDDTGPSSIEIVQSPLVRPCVDVGWLRQQLTKAAEVVSRDTGRRIEFIDVRIVCDSEMIDQHRTHKGEARTTDVLSFDLAENVDGAPIQADIIVCADVARRQAGVLGHATERELMLYMLHGLLHCAGYDDTTDSGFDQMHAAEDRILMHIGIGATFSAAAGTNAAREDRQ